MIKQRLTPMVSGLLLAALVAGCAVNPVTGRNELSLFDETQEINLGTNQYGPTQQSQGGPYTANPELSDYVSKVGQRLARVSDRSLPYEFVIIDDSTPNAWALPGGKIGINRGLLVRLNSEAELAAVLSHEIVHAAARHSAKSIERGLLVDGVLNAAGAALESGNVNYAGIVQDGARLGSQMLLQSYGREAELESDAYGMIYMLRAGYDPEAAVSLQETFVALSSGRSSDWLSGLLASHPPSEERVAKNRARADRLNPDNAPLELGFERYQAALANLTSQSKAYDLLEAASKAWAQGNLASARDIANEAKRLSPSIAKTHTLLGEIALKQRDWSAALGHFDRAISLAGAPGYFKDYLGRGLARVSLNQDGNAKSDLDRSMALLPTEAAKDALDCIENDQR